MLETELKKNTEALNRLATALEGNNVHVVGGSASDSGLGSGGGNVAEIAPEEVGAGVLIYGGAPGGGMAENAPGAVAGKLVGEIFTVEQLNAGMQSVAKGAGGMPAAMAILQNLGVSGIGELDESRYPELAASIRAAGGIV